MRVLVIALAATASAQDGPTLDYAGYDATLMPELASGVEWSDGKNYGPMEAYAITPEELSLRDDISDVFEVSYSSTTGAGSGSYDAFDPASSGGDFYDEIKNMFCDPMDLGQYIVEAEDAATCKDLCFTDVNCEAIVFYKHSDDPSMTDQPYTGCYHFASCDANHRAPAVEGFGATLYVKQQSFVTENPTMSAPCEDAGTRRETGTL